MGSWRAALSYSPRFARPGLTRGSGWSDPASFAFFEVDPAPTGANRLNNLYSIASGSSTVGSSAETLDALVGAGTGAHGAAGTGAATLATVVSAASGSSVVGSAAATLATVVSAATGGSTHGTSAVTLSTIVTAGAGTAAGGSSAETLAVLTSSASGARGASGSSAETLATVVSAGSGSVTFFGGAVATLLDDLTTVATDAALPVTIDFEDGTIPASLLWAGDPGTVVSRADAGGGTLLALQFRDIADSEETYFELYAVAHAPGSLSLTVRLEVSSEEGYDFLRVLVDGVDVLGDPGVDPGDEEGRSGISGGFESFTVSLSEGAHSLRFGYYKDSSADDGDDTAWISSITYPAGVRPVAAVNTLDALTSSASGETPTYPGLYRFWRIAALATQSVSGDTGLGEVELRGSLGGADLTDTLPGVATQQYGGPNDPSVCFDNDTSNYWTSGPEYEALIWEFTTFPQDVQQVWIDQGEMLDIQIAASNDGVTWEWKAIQRGNTENAYSMAVPLTIDLVGPNRHYDGYLGVNDLQQTDVFPIYCESDHIAVTAQTTWDPIRIEKLIAHSASTYPSPPIGAITYTFFCKGVIYSDDGGYPGTLIAETAEHTTLPNGQFFDLGLADWLFLLPGNYWFGVHTGGTSGNLLTHNTVGGQTTRTVARAYGLGVPATFPPGGVSLASGRPQPIYAVFPISTGEATFADATSAGFGYFGQAITGTGASILGDLVCEGAGSFLVPITGTAAALLESLSSAGFGARGVLRPRQSLNGSYRPSISLNATWVAR